MTQVDKNNNKLSEFINFHTSRPIRTQLHTTLVVILLTDVVTSLVFYQSIGVNPWGLGLSRPQILGWKFWGLHEILLYIMMYRNTRQKHSPKW